MKVDKIFEITIEEKLEFTGATLLSIEEAEALLTIEERAYDKRWWLRSPGYFSFSIANVYYVGNVNYYGYGVNYSNACVRPALQIKNLEYSTLEIGDRFKMGDYEFKIISDNLAWMYKQDIGQYAFNKDYEKGNNYETSDVKKFIDKWFRLLMFNESKEMRQE